MVEQRPIGDSEPTYTTGYRECFECLHVLKDDEYVVCAGCEYIQIDIDEATWD